MHAQLFSYFKCSLKTCYPPLPPVTLCGPLPPFLNCDVNIRWPLSCIFIFFTRLFEKNAFKMVMRNFGFFPTFNILVIASVCCLSVMMSHGAICNSENSWQYMVSHIKLLCTSCDLTMFHTRQSYVKISSLLLTI